MMFGLMLKSTHEAAMEAKDDEDFAAWNAAKKAGDEWNAKFKAAITDLAAAQEEIERLRPLAEKYEAKLARDRKRVRGGAKVSVKPAAKKGVGK